MSPVIAYRVMSVGSRYFRAYLFLGLILGLSLQVAAHADVQALGVTYHSLRSVEGDEHFVVKQSINEHGEKEVAIEHQELRRIFSDSVDVLYGRDLNSDGLIDTWFVLDSGGVLETIERTASEADGWDAASELLKPRLNVMSQSVFRAAYNFLSSGTFSGSKAQEFFRRMTRVQMDLHDIEVRTDRLARVDRRHPDVQRNYEIISRSWEEFVKEVDRAEYRDHLLWTLADEAVTIATLGMIKVAGKVISATVMKTRAAVYAKGIFDRFISKIRLAGSAAVARTSRAVSATVGVGQSVRQFMHMSLTARIQLIIRGMESRGMLTRAFAHGLESTYKTGVAGISQMRYVAQTQAIQLVAEVIQKRDVVYDPNPIIMAGKVYSNKDIMQNLAYMTTETFLLSAVSTRIPNVWKRMEICAVISVVDSIFMNYMFRHETDIGRNALDTGWEVTIGNAQTQVDIIALGHYEKVAQAQGNPKLKLVGYAVAFVDQAIGYFAYGWTTDAYEKRKQNRNNDSMSDLPLISDPQIELVPIFAPA